MTFVVEGGEGIVEQVEKQLYKLIDVVKVTDLTKENAVVRELALIKVRCRPDQRREVLDLVEIFRAQAVDVTQNGMVIQLVAQPETVDGLVENLRSYGIREMVRSGKLAIARGSKTTAVHEQESPATARFHHDSGRRPEGELPFTSK